MAKKRSQEKKAKFKVPKGPCDPEPPEQPPRPAPTPPWDRLGPDPLKGLKTGKKR